VPAKSTPAGNTAVNGGSPFLFAPFPLLFAPFCPGSWGPGALGSWGFVAAGFKRNSSRYAIVSSDWRATILRARAYKAARYTTHADASLLWHHTQRVAALCEGLFECCARTSPHVRSQLIRCNSREAPNAVIKSSQRSHMAHPTNQQMSERFKICYHSLYTYRIDSYALQLPSQSVTVTGSLSTLKKCSQP